MAERFEPKTDPVRFPAPRFLILIFLVPLGFWLFGQARSSWRDYWIMHDGQQGTATVTKEYAGGHGRLVYQYTVSQKQFTGVSNSNWKDEKYRDVRPGNEAPVYFSTSHPWLSQLYKPEGYIDVLPALAALALAVVFVMTAVNPKSKLALNVDRI